MLIALLVLAGSVGDVPVVVVDRDDVVITESCRVVIPAGTVIDDANGDGVIHIGADGVRVEFAPGSVLVGRDGLDRWLREGPGEGDGWDTLTGTGIVVEGHEGVEIVNASVSGFRVGVLARDADGLRIENATLTDLWRQRLTSTATREGAGDWLWPHKNDDNEWLTNYGAAVWVEDSEKVSLRGVTVRRGQNGIVLDASDGCTVTESDCSFLSGWGLAMWRASANVIRDNRFDFCVRGHVEGVYNRGQDSAGILMFEACVGNAVVGNSATHGGDGVFGFGGHDAIEVGKQQPWGNGINQFLGNDLSFASAHGLEMTFSESNHIADNLIEGNAICGIWGGYSRGMWINGNTFVGNGGMAYGQERGAINIEHGSNNAIADNSFINNKVGVRLWWDHDAALLAKPGIAAGYRGVTGNVVVANRFRMDAGHPFDRNAALLGIEVQDLGDAPGYEGPRVGQNAIDDPTNTWEIEPGVGTRIGDRAGGPMDVAAPAYIREGWRFPVPGRRSPAGREWVVMDEWGAWDFTTPLAREHDRTGGADRFEVFVPVGSGLRPEVDVEGGSAEIAEPAGPEGWRPWTVTITPGPGAAVSSYEGRIRVGERWSRPIAGRFVDATWSVRAWSWDADPLVDADAWRAEAAGVDAVELDRLDLPFGNAGPESVDARLPVPGRDRFGLVASTAIALPPGKWRVRTLSDDGIRVFVDGAVVIERWDIHGPTEDAAEFGADGPGPTQIRVEYFENSGYATLRVELEPAD